MLKNEIRDYIKDKNENDYLFPSRQTKYNQVKHISYERAYQILMEVFKRYGIRECSAHTLRKTFGYWFYKRTKDLEILRKIFNHSSQSITRIYIGIESDEIDKTIDYFGGL